MFPCCKGVTELPPSMKLCKIQQNTDCLIQLIWTALPDVPNQTPMPQTNKQLLNPSPVPTMYTIVRLLSKCQSFSTEESTLKDAEATPQGQIDHRWAPWMGMAVHVGPTNFGGGPRDGPVGLLGDRPRGVVATGAGSPEVAGVTPLQGWLVRGASRRQGGRSPGALPRSQKAVCEGLVEQIVETCHYFCPTQGPWSQPQSEASE